jgi:iron(III) transport system substrate-binding protein
MKRRHFSRRAFLQASSAVALTAFASPLKAAAPEASAITPVLVEAAKKEGKIVWYTSVDLMVAEKIAQAFQAKYPGITTQVERSGAERIFQRIGQEVSSNLRTVDVVNSSDAAHFIVWKRNGLLAPYLPEDVAKHYPAEHKDPDGFYATWRAWLSIIAYNTSLVNAEEAPKSFADLLDPKWKGKIVKAHPSYSGTILTSTYEMVQTLGWEYFEKLSKQDVLQVQSSTEPPKKLLLGERAVMADGNEYNIFLMKEAGRAVEAVYATEGSPIIAGPNGIFKTAPHPNAARLFQNWMFTREAQEIMVEVGGLRSVHPLVKDKPGRKPLKDIKLMQDNAAEVERQSAELKARYTQYFRV